MVTRAAPGWPRNGIGRPTLNFEPVAGRAAAPGVRTACSSLHDHVRGARLDDDVQILVGLLADEHDCCREGASRSCLFRECLVRPLLLPARPPVLMPPQSKKEIAMALADEIDEIFRREVKSLPAYAKAQAASGSGVAPPVDEMNHLLMGLVVASQRSFHLLADRIENVQKA